MGRPGRPRRWWWPYLRFRGAVPLVVLVVVWQILGSQKSYTFPTPLTWLSGLRSLASGSDLWGALGSTATTFFLSLIIATIVGSLVGIGLGASPRAMRAATPVMDFFRALPPAVIVPAASLVLGISTRASVIVVTLSIIWPILLNTASAMHQVHPVRLEMARALGLSWPRRAFKITLPSVAPGIFTGCRLAVSVSMIVTLIVEIFSGTKGVGDLLYNQQQLFNAQGVWGILLVIGVFGFVLNALLRVCEQQLLHNSRPAEGH